MYHLDNLSTIHIQQMGAVIAGSAAHHLLDVDR